jgi:hypothetical protein
LTAIAIGCDPTPTDVVWKVSCHKRAVVTRDGPESYV